MKMKPKLKIKISPLFIVLLVFSVVTHSFFQCCIYFIVVILHEFAHYATAQKFGYELNTLHLMPYGAALSGDISAASCEEEIIIALAGPLFNLICAIFFVAMWWIYPAIYVVSDTIVAASSAIAFFNFLPVYPLDGGRILNAILNFKMIKRKKQIMRVVALTIIVVFISICVILLLEGKINISFVLASTFMISGTFVKDKDAFYRNLYSMTYRTEKIKKGLVVKEIMVFDDETISSLLKKLTSNYYIRFLVVNKNLETVCVINETQLLNLSKKSQQNSTISNIIAKKNLISF